MEQTFNSGDAGRQGQHHNLVVGLDLEVVGGDEALAVTGDAANNGVSWEPLPSYKAQSTKDVEIAKIVGQTVTIPAGDSTVTINPYSLTKEQNVIIIIPFQPIVKFQIILYYLKFLTI